MLNRTIKPIFAIPIVILVAISGIAASNSAADRAVRVKPRDVGETYCLKCHHDMKTLRAMQDKAGNSNYCAAKAKVLQEADKGKQANGKSSGKPY